MKIAMMIPANELSELDLEILPFDRYSLIIDARTPKEYFEDHIPGSINLPVVDQDEFAEVGTLHKENTYEAYFLGVTYALQRISNHLKELAPRLKRSDHILVYCFRGGKRSKLWADQLRTIGLRVDTVRGGWKNYRRWVVAGLEQISRSFDYRVLSGPTGCGKTRLLDALRKEGAQVLDLEGLANHRGSLIGAVPGQQQPSQKYFETLLLHTLRHFDTDKPVWVEDESKRIGKVQLPVPLHEAMAQSPVIRVDAPLEERVRLWHEDYGHFKDDLPGMVQSLSRLNTLVGNKEVQLWRDLAAAGKASELFERLMTHHYDPAYARTFVRRHAEYVDQPTMHLSSLDAESLGSKARQLLADIPVPVSGPGKLSEAS